MQNSTLSFKNGLKDGLPIGLGYLSVSFAFGVSASLLGVPALISLFVSMTNLTSAGQLAGIGIIAALGSFAEIILTQIVINSRYFLMSVTLTQKTDDTFSFKKRLFCAAFITDEIFAVASAKPQKINVKYFCGLSLLPYIGWSLGTILGALLGNVMPQNVTFALGVAIYAMFIAIIVPPSLKNAGVLFTVVFAAGISCAIYYIPQITLSEGMSVIICALFTSLVAAALFPLKKENEGNERHD